MAKPRFKRPDMSLKDAVTAAKAHDKGQKGIRKQFTSLRTKDAGSDAAYDSGITRPTDEQLAAINTLTRTPKTADEVVVFSTMSCNDLLDRDLDKFTTQTVKDFATLGSPYGSIGKSFMVSHDYSKLPVGRIFEAGTKEVDGSLFMTNGVYIPNTPQYQDFIENQDFGIYWAVSVGVMLDSVSCSVCGEGVSSWGGYCFAGHVKGLYYPEGDEGDPSGWDWAEPVAESTKGAVQCVGLMEGAKDFYELSQCFLGAQFDAELAKSPGMKGIMKAASANHGIVNLGVEEAKALPLQRVPAKVADAAGNYTTETNEDGEVKWTDDAGLVWVYDPTTSEVLCLGKASDDTESSDEEEDGEDGEGDQSGASGEQEPLGDDAEEQGSDLGEPGQRDDGEGVDGDADADLEEEPGSDGSVEDPDDSDDDEEEDAPSSDSTDTEGDMDKAAVLAAAKRAKIPATLLSVVDEAKDNGLHAVLRAASKHMAEQESTIKALTGKAAVGEEYLKDLQADAINWYVKARQDGESKGVSTDTFERLLTACGDNIDLVKALRDEQVTLAQAKFPQAVRRSSFPDDPNERKTLSDPPSPDADPASGKRVSRLHG